MARELGHPFQSIVLELFDLETHGHAVPNEVVNVMKLKKKTVM